MRPVDWTQALYEWGHLAYDQGATLRSVDLLCNAWLAVKQARCTEGRMLMPSASNLHTSSAAIAHRGPDAEAFRMRFDAFCMILDVEMRFKKIS